MITPAIKDKILSAIIAEDESVSLAVISYKEIFPKKEIKYWEFKTILQSFEELGLVKNVSCSSEDYNTVVRMCKLYDLFQRGGFVGQEEILRANLFKLNSELLKLEKELGQSYLDRIKNILDIANSISGFFSGISS